MPQAAAIKSLLAAFRVMKAMQAQGIKWGDDYRQATRAASVGVVKGWMRAVVDRHLDMFASLS